MAGDLGGRHGPPDLAQRLHSCVPDDRLLHHAGRLQRRQQRVGVPRAPHIRHKVTQLLRYGLQHLVLVVRAVRQEGNQLLTRPLLTQRQRNGLQPPDAVQLQLHVVVLGRGHGRKGRSAHLSGSARPLCCLVVLTRRLHARAAAAHTPSAHQSGWQWGTSPPPLPPGAVGVWGKGREQLTSSLPPGRDRLDRQDGRPTHHGCTRRRRAALRGGLAAHSRLAKAWQFADVSNTLPRPGAAAHSTRERFVKWAQRGGGARCVQDRETSRLVPAPERRASARPARDGAHLQHRGTCARADAVRY